LYFGDEAAVPVSLAVSGKTRLAGLPGFIKFLKIYKFATFSFNNWKSLRNLNRFLGVKQHALVQICGVGAGRGAVGGLRGRG
jgi:hypothetical protein